MNWESVGGIAATALLVLTVFLEWPKIVTRYKSIPPYYISSIALILFFIVSYSSIAFVFLNIHSNYLVLLIVISLASNIIMGIVLDDLRARYFEENKFAKSAIFFIWGGLIQIQLIVALLACFRILQ